MSRRPHSPSRLKDASMPDPDLMTDACVNCNRILQGSEVSLNTIVCGMCFRSAHFTCTDILALSSFGWTCGECVCSMLPFFSVVDYDDLLEILQRGNEKELMIGSSVEVLNEFILPEIFVSSDRQLLNNAELDPDQLYSQFGCKDSHYIEVCKLDEFFDFQDKSSLNVMHINCRSMKKNINAVITLLSSMSGLISALAVTETWLLDNTDDMYNISGYTFISKCRTERTGGGIGIYLRSDFTYIVRNDISMTNGFIECLFVEIVQADGPNVIIGSVYRPPGTDVTLFVYEFIKILDVLSIHKAKLVLIAGDYNLDLLKADTHAPTGEFLNCLLTHSFLPTIHYPTRITKNSATLIDNIFVNRPIIDSASAIVYSDISDHFPVVMHIPKKCGKRSIDVLNGKRDYSNDRINCFKFALSETDWSDVLLNCDNSVNPNESYSIFISRFNSLFENYFPVKDHKISKNNSPRTEWITKGLIKSCKRKSKLYRLWINNPTTNNRSRYIKYRNKLNTLVKLTEKDYYSCKLKECAGNLRETWKVIRNVLNKSATDTVMSNFVKDGNLITRQTEIVENFNMYFSQIGDRLASSIPLSTAEFTDYLKSSPPNSFAFHLSDPNEVIHIVDSFKNKSSFGYDKIPLMILKNCIREIAEPISAILNSSMTSGIFPDDLKIAKVCPIFKAGPKNECSNYRPISVLSSFSKIFEKAVYTRLENYINYNNILSSKQYGFRSKYSTYMAMLDMCNNITDSVDNKLFSVGIFIDLAKAFDTINHKILLTKLEHYGIRGITLQWFSDYLSNRKQYVSVSNVNSNYADITCGVPQGSVLGPLLFIIYINDVVNCSSLLRFVLFADDTSIFYSNKYLDVLMTILNNELHKLSTWFQCNKLSLNVKKTHYIVFGSKNKLCTDTNFQLYIDGHLLQRVTSTPFLGIIVDDKLNWKAHTYQISLKVSRGLGILNRVKGIFSQDILKTLYLTLIQPYFQYCNIIWGGASHFALSRLIVLQKRAVRLITYSHYRAHSCPLFIRTRILRLADIHVLQLSLFMYKTKHGLIPPSCVYTVASSNSRYNLRRKRDFIDIPFHTDVRKRHVAIAGPYVWKSLSDGIKASPTVFIFKRMLTRYMLCNYS